MSAEENKALMRRWYEELARGNLAVVDELLDPDIVDHGLPPGMPAGREGSRQVLTMYFSAFSDPEILVEDLIAEGDKVVARCTFGGTHQGEFMGIPPTGKRIAMNMTEILRIADGKMVEHWESFDQLGLLQQLGAIPAPG